MKKLILVLHFAFCILPFVSAQQNGWKNITPNLPKFYKDTTIINGGADTIVARISGISFIDDNHGWICTGHPFEGEPSAVLETTDGGETWTEHSVPYSAVDIHMIDEQNGYLGVENGFIYKTTDGGETWALHGLLQAHLYDLGFPPRPAQTGYAGGKNGRMAIINNEGVSSFDLGLAGNVYCIDFPSVERGYAILDYQMIIFYMDGEWHIEASYPYSSKDWLFFLNDTVGWCVGEMFLKTEAGIDWYRTDPEFVQTGAMMGVFFTDENNGWAVGNPGQIVYTHDGGNDWTMLEHNLTDALLTGVLFTSPNNGFIIGGDKTILKYGPVSGLDNKKTEPDLKIVPNPVTSHFTIHIPDSGLRTSDLKLEIVDFFGKIVAEFQDIADLTLDISHLTPGVYLCRIHIGNRLFINKIVKV